MVVPYLVFFATMTYMAECYDEKFDKIDIDEVINDETLFNSYLNCFLDKGPCNAEYASEFKDIIPEMLSDTCAKCSKLQKNNVKKVFKVLYEKRTDVLAEFEKKYDPKNEYKANVLAILQSKDD